MIDMKPHGSGSGLFVVGVRGDGEDGNVEYQKD